jgi:hypothetical protein
MNTPSAQCNSCGSWWRLPLLLASILVAVWLIRGRGVREPERDPTDAQRARPASAAAGQTVSLTIDFGDGRRTDYEPIAWREGQTVQDVTRESQRSDLKLKTLGTGQSAFLASLDGIENEGANGRNWIYSVNDKSGDRSFGVYELQPGDHVLWTFGKQ